MNNSYSNLGTNLSVNELVHLIETKLKKSNRKKLMHKKMYKYSTNNKIIYPWTIINEYYKLIILIAISISLLICIIPCLC